MDRKRILALFLSVCLITSQPVFTASATTAEPDANTSGIVEDIPSKTKQEFVTNPVLEQVEFTHTVTADENGNISLPVSGILVDIVLPSEIGGYAVTNITANAFRSTALFKTVTIPTSITKIGANAFADCVGLEYIILKDRATYEGMELGENWSGTAKVVFEKVIVVNQNTESEPADTTEQTKPEPTTPEGVYADGTYTVSRADTYSQTLSGNAPSASDVQPSTEPVTDTNPEGVYVDGTYTVSKADTYSYTGLKPETAISDAAEEQAET